MRNQFTFFVIVVFLFAGFGSTLSAAMPPLNLDSGGLATNILEISPRKTHENQILVPGNWFVWIAVKVTKQGYNQWNWKKYGPFNLEGKTRYSSHLGLVDYVVSQDRNPRFSALGRGDTSISVENLYADKTIAVVFQGANGSTFDYDRGKMVQEMAADEGSTPMSLTGIWDEADNPVCSNSYMTYSQEGNKIRAKGTFVYQGFTCEWIGTGSVAGSSVKHSVDYQKRFPDPAWKGADGRLELSISKDGKTLTGKWFNNNGDSGTKRYLRRK